MSTKFHANARDNSRYQQLDKGLAVSRHSGRRALCFPAVLILMLGLTAAATAQSRPTPGRSPQPSSSPLPPNAPGSVVRPSNEVQQSTQPQTGPEQQRRQTTPNTEGP